VGLSYSSIKSIAARGQHGILMAFRILDHTSRRSGNPDILLGRTSVEGSIE
jgi:hypothetical protein